MRAWRRDWRHILRSASNWSRAGRAITSSPRSSVASPDMLARLIELSVRNRLFITLATLVLIASGIYALVRTPLDALPDLSDAQVIIYTPYSGQAPQVVEDQVTYPLTTAMLAVPKAKVVRG